MNRPRPDFPRPGRRLFLLLAAAGLSASMTCRISWRGSLRAGGTILPGAEARFASLRIGAPKRPLDDTTPLFVRFSNGMAVASAAFRRMPPTQAQLECIFGAPGRIENRSAL